jgi:dienelactone hydrolase
MDISGTRRSSTQYRVFAGLFLLAFLLVGCDTTAVTPVPGQDLSTPARLLEVVTTVTAVPATNTITGPVSATPTAANSPTPTQTAALTPSPTPDPYAELTIEALAARRYGGGELDIIDTLEENDTFARYLFTYPSDGLTIYGYMTVPNEGRKFPVAILLHGYIDPDEYETVAYTRRYADALAEAGYFVIHPNFRNYPPSDSGPDPFRIGYAIDVLNLIAIIRQQSQDPFGYLRRADADDIHLWGHSMGGGVALRVITVNNAPYIKTAVLYGSMSGDEAQNYGRIQRWSGGHRGDFELEAPPATLRAISPVYHLDRARAAISVHHSADDQVVPLAWSEQLCRLLQALEHPHECFTYHGQPHTFHGGGDALFMKRVISFFDRH